MTEFASTQNSPAEQRALLNLLIDTFDATVISGTGLERARQRAALSEGEGAGAGIATLPEAKGASTRMASGSASPSESAQLRLEAA